MRTRLLVAFALLLAASLACTDGVPVSHIKPGSPAAEAGLEIGDAVLAWAGEEPESPRALRKAVRQSSEGATVVVERNGGRLSLGCPAGLQGVRFTADTPEERPRSSCASCWRASH